MELVRTNSVLLVVQLSEAGKSRREVKTAIAAEISCHAAGCRCLGAAGLGNPAGFLCPISIVCRLGSCEDRARVNRPIPPHAPRSSRPSAKGPRHWPDWPVAQRVAGAEKMVSGAPVGL